MLDSLFLKFPDPADAETSPFPPGWTAVAGDPQVRAKRNYTADDGSVISGFWECTPGTFEVVYSALEFCHLISGHCRITPDGKAAIDLRAGDAFILEPGFTGRWEVLETMRKHFVFKFAPKA